MKLGITLEFSDFFDEQWIRAISNGLDIDFVQVNLVDEMLYDNCRYLKLIKGIKTVLHAPRVDLGNKENFFINETIIHKTKNLADKLSSDSIVIHPGAGNIFETIRQFRSFYDSRVAVENLSCSGYVSSNPRHGVTPIQIQYIMTATGVKFCLDFAHAICSANFLKEDTFDTLSKYKQLSPALYHLSDGFMSDTKDKHLHLGDGDYDLNRILMSFIAENDSLVLETGVFDRYRSVDSVIADIKFAKKMLNTLFKKEIHKKL